MEPIAAQALARALMDQHGLRHWRFGFDRAKRRFGCCWQTRRAITLSVYLTSLNSEAEVRDTILHEIAHALVPGGHTPAWQAKCRQIGAKPERCFDGEIKTPAVRRWQRYVAICACKIEHIRHRRPDREYECRNCRTRLKWEYQVRREI